MKLMAILAFGPVDVVKYAAAFGATGLMIKPPDDIGPMLRRAFKVPGAVIIGVHVVYRDNQKLLEMVNDDGSH
jgi:acetolactate synthase-1/2/3 large subunit